jgi:Cdc6-like AAA superfamily ATPase
MLFQYLLPIIAALTSYFIYTFISELYKEYERKKNNDTTITVSKQKTNNKKQPHPPITNHHLKPSLKKHKIFDNDSDEQDLSKNNLFDYNPPQSAREIQEVFINRKEELELDVQYFNDKFCSNKINVIYGSSRTGKSHYMKKLLIELNNKGRLCWFQYINANSKGTVRYVLYKTFQYLQKGIMNCSESDTIDKQFVRALLLDMNRLIEEAGDETIAHGHTKTFFSDQNISISLLSCFSDLPDFIKIPLLNDQINSFIRPSNSELIELIKFQAKFLVDISHGKYQSILLAIDDVDLLYFIEERKNEVNDLYNLLSELSESNKINVLITTRQDFATDRGKDFEYFREILPLKETDLNDLYKERIKLYNQDQDVFSPDILTYLIKCAEGKPGIFLNHCKRIFKEVDHSSVISEQDLYKALDNIVKKYLDNSNPLKRYVETIKSEVLEHIDSTKPLIVELPIHVSNTELLFLFIMPSNQSGKYEINILIKDYFELRAKS